MGAGGCSLRASGWGLGEGALSPSPARSRVEKGGASPPSRALGRQETGRRGIRLGTPWPPRPPHADPAGLAREQGRPRTQQRVISAAPGGHAGAQPLGPSAGRGPGPTARERPVQGGRRWLWPGDPVLPAPTLWGPRAIREASSSVYFQVTFFKKNSFPQMLDPASGMWRGKQLSTARPCAARRGAGAGGPPGDVAVRGQSVEPGSGLRSQSRRVPSRALTPPRPGQAQLILALVHRPGPGGLRLRSRPHAPRPGRPRTSAPAGLLAGVPLGLRPAPALPRPLAPASRKPSEGAQRCLLHA